MAANGRCIERKIYCLKTISTPGSTLMQTRSFCAWLDWEMQVAQNPHLDHAHSAPFAFCSTKRLGVYRSQYCFLNIPSTSMQGYVNVNYFNAPMMTIQG